MTRAYDKLYLEKAQESLATMFDYAVADLGLDIDRFADLFVASGYADRFGRGEAALVVGKSGVELADEVVAATGGIAAPRTPSFPVAYRTPEYWTGWALAYYQWTTAKSFREILSALPASRIRALYAPCHEMDITQFVDRMNERLGPPVCRLKALRVAAGLSQSELAARSGVPLRTVQHYEQGSKDLRRAAGETLLSLARALGLRVDGLL